MFYFSFIFAHIPLHYKRHFWAALNNLSAIMPPDLPEEIWNLVLCSLAELGQNSPLSALEPIVHCNHRMPVAANGRVISAHLNQKDRRCSNVDFLKVVSLVSHSFHRLVLPLLHREIVVDIPCPCQDNGLEEFIKNLIATPHTRLVK